LRNHFHGEYGLEAELIDAGVMDPETKVIKTLAEAKKTPPGVRRGSLAAGWGHCPLPSIFVLPPVHAACTDPAHPSTPSPRVHAGGKPL